jgi:colanic acid/amylovoran biosynthesis glycosyltransferase
MKPLKIAMVTGLFPTVSETFVVNQIIALKKTGHNVDVFCFKKNEEVLPNASNQINVVKELDWRKFMPEPFGIRLLKIIEILTNSMTKKDVFNRLFKALFYKSKINTHYFFKMYFSYFFKIKNYDVIHVHFGNNAVCLLPQLKHFDKKIFVTFHGFDINNYDKDYYKELFLIKNINFTTNTNFAKLKLINLGVLDFKVTVLPDGIDTSFFSPNKKEHSRFNILFVGRLIKLKAPLLAIQIVEKIIKKEFENVHLTIVGAGDEFVNCNAYLKKHNLGAFVSLVGEKSQEEIVEYMNLSDVFLFPGIIDGQGRCETQGLVLREAQAMKIPVIISDVGGMHEGVINGETGWVLPANNIEAFADVLIELINNPLKQKAMGEAGRSFILKHYDNTALVKSLLEIYQK